ncbi:hypothetical protein RAS1_33170 [Phycisphaerae bacterium RAS1]|nr:hypothetical protein RAS1_33170 [Phycisphaerae bacterium RAS1]
MAKRWWAVFKTRTNGKVADRTGGANEVVDAATRPPVLSIQTAPVKEGQELEATIMIREVDAWDNEKSKDDNVAYFKGKVSKSGGRFYFKQTEWHPIVQAKPGPEIEFYFEAPGGKTDGPYKFRLTGDEIEKSEWELGWQIIHGITELTESNALVRIRQSDYAGSEQALINIRQKCLNKIIEFSMAASRAARKWTESAEAYGEAYRVAHGKFMKPLKEASERAAKQAEALTSFLWAVLSLVGGGALKLFVSRAAGPLAAQALKDSVPEAFHELVKDKGSAIVEAAVGKAEEKFKESTKQQPKEEISLAEPEKFKSELKVRVSKEFGAFADSLYDAYRYVNDDSKVPDSQLNNQDVDALERSYKEFVSKSAQQRGLPLHVMSPPHRSIPYVSKADGDKSVEAGFETGMWSIWLQQHVYKFNSAIERYLICPKEVVERLKALGIFQKAGAFLDKNETVTGNLEAELDSFGRTWPGREEFGSEGHYEPGHPMYMAAKRWQPIGKALFDWAKSWQSSAVTEYAEFFKTDPPEAGGAEDRPSWALSK